MRPHIIYWYDSREELARLCEWLYERGDINHPEDVIAIIDEPWHWQRERDEMIAERAREEVGTDACRA